jgi:GT2 family glycosyltransferase
VVTDAVTIVVPTIRARPDYLDRCLAECERTMRQGDRLVIAEGGTFAENCNEGGLAATTPYIVFLNDDTKADQDDWLDRLTDPFQHPDVGVVGCRLIYPDGRLQHTGITFMVDSNGHLHGQNRTIDAPSGLVGAVTGACLAIRADVFRAAGGFDENYRNGNEDVDLCLRVRNAGHDVYYQADCTIIHHESASGPARWAHVADNVVYFNERWKVTNDPAA